MLLSASSLALPSPLFAHASARFCKSVRFPRRGVRPPSSVRCVERNEVRSESLGTWRAKGQEDGRDLRRPTCLDERLLEQQDVVMVEPGRHPLARRPRVVVVGTTSTSTPLGHVIRSTAAGPGRRGRRGSGGRELSVQAPRLEPSRGLRGPRGYKAAMQSQSSSASSSSSVSSSANSTTFFSHPARFSHVHPSLAGGTLVGTSTVHQPRVEYGRTLKK